MYDIIQYDAIRYVMVCHVMLCYVPNGLIAVMVMVTMMVAWNAFRGGWLA